MYTMYQDGENIGTFETSEDVSVEVAQLRKDYVNNELRDMAIYPQYYAEGYEPGANFNEYFRDVYEVKLDGDVEQFL